LLLDESTDKLRKAAKDADIYVVIGMHERNTEASNSSLYNTIVFIDGKGNIMGNNTLEFTRIHPDPSALS
jgi:nitrilase